MFPSRSVWVSVVRRYLQRPLFREPLLYFVLVGASVFALDHRLRSNARTIRVTPLVRNEISRSLEERIGHPPRTEELTTEISRWKEEEALYREGLRLRLFENDVGIRARLAEKVLELGRTRTVVAQPTEPEMRRYYESHLGLFTPQPTYDFEQVFVSQTHSDARARAEQILVLLRQGAPSGKWGDPFLLGHQIKGETTDRISVLLGERIAKELPTYTPGDWNLVEGNQGFHVMRVTHVERISPDFEKVRHWVVSGLIAERQERAAAAFNREIVAQYRFVSLP